MRAAKVKSSGRLRLLRLSTAVPIAALFATVGLLGASAAPLQGTATTLTITDTATGQPITGAIKPDEEVTLTATVTGSSSNPSGTIGFQNTTANTPLCDSGDVCSWALQQTGPTTAQKSVNLYLPSGTYDVQAAFRPATGSGFLPSSSSKTSVTITAQQTLDTTTTLSVSPNPITEGATATLTATVASGDGSIPQGTVTFYSTSGNTKTFIQTATLDAKGQASIARSDWAVGDISLEADYLGDTFVDVNGDAVRWLSSSNSPNDPVSLTVDPVPVVPSTITPTGTTLTDLPDARAYVGRTATLSARLLDSADNPLANETVMLSANDVAGTSCTAQTDATGLASCTASFPAAGTYTVTAIFAGAGGYTASSDSSQQIEIDTIPTAVDYAGATSAVSGTQVTLAGRLVDTLANAPLQGQTLTLTLYGTGHTSESCSGTTDATGLASCPVTVGEPGRTTPYPVDVSYSGSGTYGASSGTGSLTVLVPTSLAYAGDAQVVRGSKATLAATLLAAGQPLAGETVQLTLASGESCSATTDATGLASCRTTTAVNGLGGPDAVSLSFAGDGAYAASTGSGSLTVLVPTATSLAAVTPALQGSSAQLSGTLTAAGAPLAGQSLTLSLGSQSCTATTSAAGVATCTIAKISAALGPAATGAGFAAGGYYLGSSASGSTLVYALPAGGGAFVVGDRSDSGHVTFWGSQWWKVNSLSGGDPSSFKGFAANAPSLACGAAWSTDPGNSAPPPPAPLPAYMAVLVSSNNVKSGSQISGNVAAVVIVKTDPGYAADPGHAGTGTVVGTVCVSG